MAKKKKIGLLAKRTPSGRFVLVMNVAQLFLLKEAVENFLSENCFATGKRNKADLMWELLTATASEFYQTETWRMLGTFKRLSIKRSQAFTLAIILIPNKEISMITLKAELLKAL